MFSWRKYLSITLFTLLYVSGKNEGVKIMNCKTTKLTLYEDAPESITCGNLTKYGANIWRHHDDNKIIGECSAEGNCTNYFNNTCTLRRDPLSTESRLTIISHFRDFGSDHITCEDQESKTSHSCLLIIKHHPVLSDCQVQVNSTGYVSGSCVADKLYSSDGLYSCDWKMTGPKGQTKRVSPGSWGNTKTCKNDYCWGTCSFSHPLPKEKGIYSYTIIVLDSAKATFSHNVIIGASQENTKHSNYAGVITGVVLPIILVIAGITTILVCLTHKKRQIKIALRDQAIQSKGQNEDYDVHINVVYNFKEQVAVPQKEQEMNQYVESTEPSLQSLDEVDHEFYEVICDDDREKSDDEELYHKIFDDAPSHETLPTLSLEQELADL